MKKGTLLRYLFDSSGTNHFLFVPTVVQFTVSATLKLTINFKKQLADGVMCGHLSETVHGVTPRQKSLRRQVVEWSGVSRRFDSDYVTAFKKKSCEIAVQVRITNKLQDVTAG